MYGYVYITTNLVNFKRYIGSKKSSKFLAWYVGSGTIIKKAVSKYGRENFSVEPIEFCSSQEELESREAYWIDYYDAVNSNRFYNLSSAKNGSARESKRSQETKAKLSNSAKNRTLPYYIREKISKTVSSQIWVNNGIIETKATPSNLDDYLNRGFLTGRLEFTESHRNHCGNAMRGKHHSDNTRLLISIKTSGSRNPFYGKKHSEDSKSKIRESQSNRHYINNGIICKRIKEDEMSIYLDNGWVRGMIRSSTTIEKVTSEKSTSE